MIETRIRAMRGGNLNESNFGERMRGSGPEAELLTQLFATACRRAHLPMRSPELSTAAFRRPENGQLWLF